MSDRYISGLSVYLVGGAIRDELLGLPVGDKDWVVVGADPQTMIDRGFIPVGDDFPVFLHPQTHEEYALARTERKSGHGYKGFVFYTGTDVSLEQDLARRDLTINAIARDADGNLIDPCGGIADIQNKTLRHIGQAFIEDPVRLLRLARFAARFEDFDIAKQTADLSHAIVASGELDALVPERVWQEFAKGLMTNEPARMLNILSDFGALAKVAPKLVWQTEYSFYLNACAANGLNLEQRYALMCFWSDSKDVFLAPAAHRKMAEILPAVVKQIEVSIREYTSESYSSNNAINLFEPRLRVFELADAFRKPDRFMQIIRVAGLLTDIGNIDLWVKQLGSLRNINAGDIAKAAAGDVKLIKENLYLARLQVLSDTY